LTVGVRRLLPTPADDVELPQAYAYPTEASGAWLRANMIASADGAATVDGRAGALGNPTDQRLLGLLRALSDVVIAGAGTVVAEGYGPARVRPEYAPLRAASDLAPVPAMAVVSNRLRLDFASRFFADATARPVVVTCEAAPPDLLRAAHRVADVIVAGARVVEPAAMVEALLQRGWRRLLCEGGPTLLGSIIEAGALDELCLTMSPLLVGGPSRRIVDGPALASPARTRLTQLLIDGDDLLYARYEVLR
jgi:riboflavin biosynthesis pyrimidine reductase